MSAPAPTSAPARRPVDAASLIVLDGEGEERSVLMGRRSARHAFMPSVYVFPGGRVDRGDGAPAPALPLPPHDVRRLVRGMGARGSERRARALAAAALRETEEEVGLRPRADAGAPLRYVARAITPPGRARRFDARFFACRREALRPAPADPTDELEDVRWVPLRATAELDLARITAVILHELRERLALDPDLSRDLDVPHHRMRHRAFVRLLD